MLYLIKKFQCFKIGFNNFNASYNDNKILIFHCNVLIASIWMFLEKKCIEIQRANIILDCAIWEILFDLDLKDWCNEHMQRQS